MAEIETPATEERGGETAVRDFVQASSARLVGALAVQLGDRDLAEDVAAEAFAKAWQRWNTVGQLANPEGWVYRVAFNAALSRKRRHAAERRALERVAAGPRPGVSDPSETHVDLTHQLAGLPPRQRAAIVLRHCIGLSVEDTASAMHCAEGTVKALVHQGLTTLRQGPLVPPANSQQGE